MKKLLLLSIILLTSCFPDTFEPNKEDECCRKIHDATYYSIPGSPPWGTYTVYNSCNDTYYTDDWYGSLPYTDEDGCLVD